MKRILTVCMVIVVLFACKKSPKTSPTTQPQTGALKPNTIVVTKSIAEGNLMKMDSISLTFVSSFPSASNVSVGSVLASGISTNAPFGFLRKVIAISITNGNIVYTTEQASITDAVANCKVTYSKTFTDNDIDAVSLKTNDHGRKVTDIGTSGSYTKSFKQSISSIAYDADGDHSSTYDQVTVNGSIDISATYNFQLYVDLTGVTLFKSELLLKNTASLIASANVLTASLHEEAKLFSFNLAPIEIDIVGIPLVIVPKVDITVGVDGQITARLVAGVTNTSSLDMGIVYQNQKWSTIAIPSDNPTVIPPTFENSASVKPYIEAQLDFRPYNIPNSSIYNSNIGLDAKAYLDGEASLTPNGLQASIALGYDVTANAQIKIFGTTISPFSATILSHESDPFWQTTTGAFPILDATVAGSITSTNIGVSSTITSDGGSTISARGFCWSLMPDPVISGNKTSNGTGAGAYSATINGLISNTNYYIRAYATNGTGTSYGNSIIVTTKSPRTGSVVLSGVNNLTNITGVWVDGAGNIYAVDPDLQEIRKWPPGENTGLGTIVAGGNGVGSSANQILGPIAVVVTPNGNVYVLEGSNSRVSLWAPGSVQGITVAGGNGSGSDLTQFGISPLGMTLDDSGNIYVLDRYNYRVVKWAPGAASGTLAAGGNGTGTNLSQFGDAFQICLDKQNNLYIADETNNRVLKWVQGASSGTIVAGGNGNGAGPNQLSLPEGVFVDNFGNLYVSDYGNDRVLRFAPGSNSGIIVAGGNGKGSAANQLNNPVNLFVDASGYIYVADKNNSRIVKWPPL